MQWERPSYIFVNMSAEIGAYQDDLGRTADTPGSARNMLEGEPRDQPTDIASNRLQPESNNANPCPRIRCRRRISAVELWLPELPKRPRGQC